MLLNWRGSLVMICAVLGCSAAPAWSEWPELANANSFTPVCNRLAFPTGSLRLSRYTSGLGQVFCRSPSYKTSDIRLLYVNFYVSPWGDANPERKAGNPSTVDFASLIVDGVAYPVTFNGKESVTLADGEFVWSDVVRDRSGKPVALPAETQYYLRTSRSVPESGNLVNALIYFGGRELFANPFVGDGAEYTTAPQIAKRLSGTVAGALQGSSAVGPAMAIGTGWDGSAVYCIVGDSIGWGAADADFSAFGVVGYMSRALDDEKRRRNFFVLAAPGTKPDDQSSTAPGQYELRMRALQSIPNKLCNHILSNMGQNSLAIAGNSLPAFQQRMANWWRFWHELFPAAPIYQTTFPPHARSTAESKWTTQSEQTSDYPNGIRWLASDWFRGRSGPPLPSYVSPVDVTPAFQDPSHPGNWKTSDWTGQLVSSAESTVTIKSPSPPPLGDVLVVDAGTPNAENLQIVGVAGRGPFVVSVMSKIARQHSPGAGVRLAYTPDGTHPSASLHRAAAKILIAMKARNLLP